VTHRLFIHNIYKCSTVSIYCRTNKKYTLVYEMRYWRCQKCGWEFNQKDDPFCTLCHKDARPEYNS